MRIVFLCPSLETKGSIPKLIPWLVEGLSALQHQVVLLSWGSGNQRETFLQKILARFQTILNVRRELVKTRPDVMVVHTGHDWKTLSRDIPLLLLARSPKTRIVIEFHGSDIERLGIRSQFLFTFFTKLFVSLSDGVFLLSTQEQKAFQSFYPRVKYFCVKNPFVPCAGGAPAEALARALRMDDRPVLLFVGRLIESKGILDLLDAMPLVVSQCGCRLNIVGNGVLEEKITLRAQQLGLQDSVQLFGYLTGDDLAAAYANADIYILPTYKEGFPTTIVEAMSHGLPIITTPLRGAADHLAEGVNGLFIPTRDPRALSAAILKLLEDPGLRERMGRSNRAMLSEFSPETVAKQYASALREVALA